MPEKNSATLLFVLSLSSSLSHRQTDRRREPQKRARAEKTTTRTQRRATHFCVLSSSLRKRGEREYKSPPHLLPLTMSSSGKWSSSMVEASEDLVQAELDISERYCHLAEAASSALFVCFLFFLCVVCLFSFFFFFFSRLLLLLFPPSSSCLVSHLLFSSSLGSLWVCLFFDIGYLLCCHFFLVFVVSSLVIRPPSTRSFSSLLCCPCPVLEAVHRCGGRNHMVTLTRRNGPWTRSASFSLHSERSPTMYISSVPIRLCTCFSETQKQLLRMCAYLWEGVCVCGWGVEWVGVGGLLVFCFFWSLPLLWCVGVVSVTSICTSAAEFSSCVHPARCVYDCACMFHYSLLVHH
jgi:hypothetical protein